MKKKCDSKTDDCFNLGEFTLDTSRDLAKRTNDQVWKYYLLDRCHI